MLWEDIAYEKGSQIVESIRIAISNVAAEVVAAMAITAREDMKLRHVPLLMVAVMAGSPTHRALVSKTLARVIQRPDELAEFVAIYWGIQGKEFVLKTTVANGKATRVPVPDTMTQLISMTGVAGWVMPEIEALKQSAKEKKVITRVSGDKTFSIGWFNRPLSAQVKLGLAQAFTKFNEYSLAKYNQDREVKLRDVLFLSHAKPMTDAEQLAFYGRVVCPDQAGVWKRLVDGTLATPDTWEVEISKSTDKKASWSRLLTEGKLGAMALLRNLRNLQNAGVNEADIKSALRAAKVERVLPFRFVAAAKHAPKLEDALEEAMFKSIAGTPKLSGRTVLILDVSGSMTSVLASRSEMSRLDAAAGLAILAMEICEDVVVYATAGYDHDRVHETRVLAPRHGFALRDAIMQSASTLGGGGIFLKQAMACVRDAEAKTGQVADRIIVFTDEQDCSHGEEDSPLKAEWFSNRNYLVNISVEKNGIGYGEKVEHIDGWSERVFDYISELETIGQPVAAAQGANLQ
jgi:hypothetical protein